MSNVERSQEKENAPGGFLGPPPGAFVSDFRGRLDPFRDAPGEGPGKGQAKQQAGKQIAEHNALIVDAPRNRSQGGTLARLS